MKNFLQSSLNRSAVIILALVLMACVAVAAANWYQTRQRAASTSSTATPDTEYAQLQFVDGQEMNGTNVTLSADVNQPPAMLLPLKTISDFDATDSATTAVITTSRGPITLQLFAQQAPLTVANFVSLARAHFYDGLHIHRVEPGFVVQMGDPLTRDTTDPATLSTMGTGYPGYRLADEFGPGLSHDQAGIVSMANINADGNYPNSGGSQFFITLAPATYLDGRHAIFGQVTDGLDILEKLQVGDEIVGVAIK